MKSWRRTSPSLTTSTPARSWSAMAIADASSAASRTSVSPYSPRPMCSRAVRYQPGRAWLPITVVGRKGRLPSALVTAIPHTLTAAQFLHPLGLELGLRERAARHELDNGPHLATGDDLALDLPGDLRVPLRGDVRSGLHLHGQQVQLVLPA